MGCRALRPGRAGGSRAAVPQAKTSVFGRTAAEAQEKAESLWANRYEGGMCATKEISGRLDRVASSLQCGSARKNLQREQRWVEKVGVRQRGDGGVQVRQRLQQPIML